MLCDEFVYPYEALDSLLLSDGNWDDAKKMFNKALGNVEKVYLKGDFYDFTDLETYIREYITDTAISDSNYKNIRKLALN